MHEIEIPDLSGLSRDAKILFLIRLGYAYSIRLRGNYDQLNVDLDASLRGTNESAHRLFQGLLGLMLDRPDRIPDQTILLILRDLAKEAGFELDFAAALSEAWAQSSH